MREFMIGGVSPTCKNYELCNANTHAIDSCHSLFVEENEEVNVVGNYNNPPQRRNDPYSHTYNEGWINHPIYNMVTQKRLKSNVINNLLQSNGINKGMVNQVIHSKDNKRIKLHFLNPSSTVLKRSQSRFNR
ncbi:hypothetical protein vseg_007407 [Gypsophila vaccaria]